MASTDQRLPMGLPTSNGHKFAGNDVCRHWVKGTCRLGASCNFRHPETAAQPIGEPRKKPKKWCRYAFRGKCPFGPNGGACVYMHVEEWVAFPQREREALTMPSMLETCASNMRKDLHNAMAESWMAKALDYKQGLQLFIEQGFVFEPGKPAHICVHEVANTIVDHASQDIARLAANEALINALQWLLERVKPCFVPAPTGSNGMQGPRQIGSGAWQHHGYPYRGQHNGGIDDGWGSPREREIPEVLKELIEGGFVTTVNGYQQQGRGPPLFTDRDSQAPPLYNPTNGRMDQRMHHHPTWMDHHHHHHHPHHHHHQPHHLGGHHTEPLPYNPPRRPHMPSNSGWRNHYQHGMMQHEMMPMHEHQMQMMGQVQWMQDGHGQYYDDMYPEEHMWHRGGMDLQDMHPRQMHGHQGYHGHPHHHMHPDHGHHHPHDSYIFEEEQYPNFMDRSAMYNQGSMNSPIPGDEVDEALIPTDLLAETQQQREWTRGRQTEASPVRETNGQGAELSQLSEQIKALRIGSNEKHSEERQPQKPSTDRD